MDPARPIPQDPPVTPQSQPAPEPQPVATLIEPAESVYHLNQVAGLTTQHIVFLKRKFASRAGHELVRYPIADCAGVKYFDERPAATIASGVLLVGLIGFIFYMLVVNWGRMEPRTRVPIGLLGLAGLYGVRRLFGARRHRLVFTLKDRTTLTWKSRPGDFDVKKLAVERIVDFARARELMHASRLVRT